MSGEHFDYKEYHLESIIDQIREDLESRNYEKDETKELTKKLLDKTIKLQDMLRSYAYMMSCDTSEETFINDWKEIYNER